MASLLAIVAVWKDMQFSMGASLTIVYMSGTAH